MKKEKVFLRPAHAIKVILPENEFYLFFKMLKIGYHRDVIELWIKLRNQAQRGEIEVIESAQGEPDLLCKLCLELGPPQIHTSCVKWNKQFQEFYDQDIIRIRDNQKSG